MMHYINREMRGDEPPDFAAMFANLTRIFDGAYNIAFINAAGDLVVMRDPLGIKPMCYAVQDDLLIVASESVVHHNLNINDVKMLAPGEMIIANRDGYRVQRYWPEQRKRYCFFEWIYFSNLASNMEGRSVYHVRNEVGRELAEMERQNGREPVGELVISIPETANTVASSFGYHLGLPVVAGLLRNRYVGRTFIDGSTRDDAVRMKFTPLTDVLEGRNIYLVDDTLVRGTTLKTVIAILKERGRAKGVHVRIGCPPVMGPCFYGIDMPTVGELFAPAYALSGNGRNGNGNDGNGHKTDLPPETLARMAAELGADSLSYLNMDGLVRATGIPKDDLCLACVNTDYPTEWGAKRYQQSLKISGLI
jgi:amidophosphoribosyltransferase